jgi:hypothetical protein
VTLDETYDRTLLNIDEEKREFAQRLVRRIFAMISFYGPPLRERAGRMHKYTYKLGRHLSQSLYGDGE